ncbi:MAG TPA: helix-turn-helix domain-containing protein [Anaerolineae bacterium]|nr:helix-turn-helix domain-containing protein [Anaerolineae bacterium]
MDDKPTATQPDPRASYERLLDIASTDELGQMLIEAVRLADKDLAAALREEIKHRKPDPTTISQLVFTREDRPILKGYPSYTKGKPTTTIEKGDPATITTKEAAELLGVSPVTVIRLWHARQIMAYKLNPTKKNSPIRVYADTVHALLRKRQQ